MAVDDFLSRDTDAFVLPSKSFYPTKIPIAHFQLRHFISCSEADLIYYASGPEVYCLNTATKTRTHLTTLPFDARCTSAGHGYVCVGGADNGNFAAIKVGSRASADSFHVDASLSLDLGHRLPQPELADTASRICLEKIGENIVNSISIHKLPEEGDKEGDVVAVLTNNDKTVRLYSLTQNVELFVLVLPFAMNHASISPDGQMLVAVGDYPKAYFFEYCNPPKTSGLKSKWVLLDQVRLHNPPGSRAEGYFTTAWSPFSRLCALGSECGYITLFDAELVRYVEDAQDAILQVISSTRPDNLHGPGSVRTMSFSPAPWDLLIWSEDQGRVCVADLRTGLVGRQILTLDPKEEGLTRIEIADLELALSHEMREMRREAEFLLIRRALDAEDTSAAGGVAQPPPNGDVERRASPERPPEVVELDNDQLGLSAAERRVIETLRSTRLQAESELTPRSIVYSTARQRNSPLENAALAANRTTPAAASAYMLETARNAAARAAGPRRQASVIVSIDEATVNIPPHALTHITDSALTRSPSLVPAHTRRAGSNDTMASTDTARRTAQQANRASSLTTRGHRLDGTTVSMGHPTMAEIRNFQQVTQMRDRLRMARGGQSPSEHYDPEMGVRTAGLAMSSDGRTLYCGTEQGIFEFKMNLHGRKMFPAITPR